MTGKPIDDEHREFREKRWLVLILLCSAQFVVALDASIVNVELGNAAAAEGAEA